WADPGATARVATVPAVGELGSAVTAEKVGLPRSPPTPGARCAVGTVVTALMSRPMVSRPRKSSATVTPDDCSTPGTTGANTPIGVFSVVVPLLTANRVDVPDESVLFGPVGDPERLIRK